MRKRFIQGNELDSVRIPDVEINTKTRHQLAPSLVALKHIFTTTELNRQVFEILDKKIGRNDFGRLGMSHWEILVLGETRLNLDIDYDFLQDLANNHALLRGILGVKTKNVFNVKKREYSLQGLKDNVSLLDEETLKQIIDVVVKAGHALIKKNEDEAFELKLKADSYPVESNIAFPTDIKLTFDSARKCLELTMRLSGHTKLKGFRKTKYLLKKLKKAYQKSADIHRRKGTNYKDRLEVSIIDYLCQCQRILDKVTDNQQFLIEISEKYNKKNLINEIFYFSLMLEKHIDLTRRRLINGETIPHHEKVFSIFEPEAEWIYKGKARNKIDLGHNTLITSDQYHFIVDHLVAVKQTDNTLALALGSRLADRFGESDYYLKSISFDRGFYNTMAKNSLRENFEMVIMPKPGNKSRKIAEEESANLFILLKNKHSAVESNINELEHTGVNKVPDKGLPAFKRYVAYGVLAYNLKRLGKLLISEEKTNSKTKSRTSWKIAA